MAKRSLKRNIIIASLIVVASFITIGVSTYVIKLDTFNSITNSNDNPIDYDDLVEVKIGYKWYTDYSETKTDPEQIGGGEYGTFTYNNNNGEFTDIGYITVSDETSYNEINKFYKNYSGQTTDLNSDTISTYTFTSIKSEASLGINEDTTQITIQCKDEDPIKKETTTGVCGSSTTYSGSYFVYKREVTEKSFTSESSSDFEDNTSIETFYVPKNSILQDDIINIYTDNIYENKTYSFNKFVKVDDNGAETDFDWKNTPITGSINLYAVFNTTNTSVPFYSNITKTINDASTNGKADTLTIYAGASDINCNVTSDSTYFSLDNSFSLGDKNTEIHIAEGDIVNFCLSDGSAYKQNNITSGRRSYVEVLNNDLSKCQFKIILQSDLYIGGTMSIASIYGSYYNNYESGTIGPEYVWLDLNGHNIYIGPNGRLENYGLITDSKGTGSIVVDGGFVLTLMTFIDYKGGTATSAANTSKQFPFITFSLPYLRCKTVFKCNNSKWGKMQGLCNIKPSSVGLLVDANINFLGGNNEDNQYFFSLEPTTDPNAFVELDIKKNKEFKEELGDKYLESTEYKYCLDYRIKWTFNRVNISLVPIAIELSVIITVNIEEFYFPIPSFFDINLNGSVFIFKEKIQFLPGSSLIADENSTIIFDYGLDSNGQIPNNLVASLTINEKAPYFYNQSKTLFIKNAFKSNSISFGGELWESELFWKYYDEVICYNYGKTLFRKNNNSSNAYTITGKYNFNEEKIGLIDENGNETLFSDDSKTIFEHFFENNTYVNTLGFSNLPYFSDKKSNLKIYALPLISNGQAYATSFSGDSIEYALKGTWNQDKYLIESNGKTYFVGFNYDGAFSDKDCYLVEADSIYSNGVIEKDTTFYILFAGIYYPVTSDFSVGATSASINMKRQYESLTSQAIQYDSNNGYWHI